MQVLVEAPEDLGLMHLDFMGWDRTAHDYLGPTATACHTAVRQ